MPGVPVDDREHHFVGRRIPLYQDLGKRIGRRTWIAVSYAIGCILLVYVLKLWAETGPMFLAAEAATLVFAASVLSENEILRLRVPFIWIVTAGFVWAYCRSSETQRTTSNEIVAISLWALFLYALIRSVSGSIEEFKGAESQYSAGRAWGDILSMWGATLQVALLWTVLIRDPLVKVLAQSWTGWPLLTVLQSIRLTSPVTWLPVGLLVLGLVVYAALRFEADPYEPKSYAEVLGGSDNGLVQILLEIVHLPLWLCIIIGGFARHFARLLVDSFGAFVTIWFGRMLLIALGFVLPTLLLMLAHWSTFGAISLIADHLSAQGASAQEMLVAYLAVHGLAIVSLCLFTICPAPLALEVRSISAQDLPGYLSQFLSEHGYPAANAVGRTFCLYGSLIIAVPVATLLPGGPSLGVFSVSYGAMLVAFVVWYLLNERS
jgi:hypothetical protein